MDLASLAVFRMVAREGSVTRAAELLGRVPSNVTTRIQQLEAEIGVSLFHRDKKRMALTAQGQTYLDYAERILHLADEAQQMLNPDAPSGALRIGSMECTVASRLPTPLARFNADWPQVALQVSTGPTRILIDSLLAQRLDCALIAVPAGEDDLVSDELDIMPVFHEELVLLLPQGHGPIAGPLDIKPRALAAFGLGCTYRRLAEEWLTGFGTVSNPMAIQEVSSYHAMFACTAAGSCISIMPRSVVDLMPPDTALDVMPLMTVDTCLASRPGFATPAFSAFRDTLLQFSDIESAGDAAK